MGSIQLLDEEKRLVGMYLSAHPLDPYYMDLEYGCNVKAAEFKNFEHPGTKVRLGGLVTGLVERISKKGSPWGILTVEDFSGSTEIRMFGKSYLEYKHFGQPGTPILIEAEFTAGRFNPEQIDFNIHSIGLLAERQGTFIRDLTLYMTTDNFINKDIYDLMNEIMFRQASSNKGDLYIVISDPENGNRVRVHSKKQISISRELVNFLKSNEIDFKINA